LGAGCHQSLLFSYFSSTRTAARTTQAIVVAISEASFAPIERDGRVSVFTERRRWHRPGASSIERLRRSASWDSPPGLFGQGGVSRILVQALEASNPTTGRR
jgi:predicted ATPase